MGIDHVRLWWRDKWECESIQKGDLEHGEPIIEILESHVAMSCYSISFSINRNIFVAVILYYYFLFSMGLRGMD